MSSILRLPLYTVDAFTSTPFTGNPAAVCLDQTKEGLSPELMQQIAAEMNISETAFIQPVKEGDAFDSASVFNLRWFTPTVEVPLCGHATLASAATLFTCQGNPSHTISFETASGRLVTSQKGHNLFGLDLPLNSPDPESKDDENHKRLAQTVSCGLEVMETYFSPTTRKLLVRLADTVTRSDLEALRPDIKSLPDQEPSGSVRGVIVTVKGTDTDLDSKSQPYDFMSRYFAPWVGIPEDPVTGSAHTVLAGYWASKTSKNTFHARQCSPRGGDLCIELKDNNRVDVSGSATIVLEGTISVPK